MHRATAHFEKHFQQYLNDLKGLVRVPSVSFPGFPAETVKESAEAVCELLKKSGLENVEVLELEGAHPYAYGERLRAPGKPTLLLYAHHDVQPPGREELWETPPFEPIEKTGPGGLRLYGRGTADDKAGIVVHTAAIDSWLKAVGELPVNVKVVIEGEEEIGSTHLAQFLKKYRDRLTADVMVLTDTMNFDCGIPALTTSLRGLVELHVEVRALSKTIHSGMWGGPLPDPAVALSKMLAGLLDDEGRIAVPGVMEQVRPLSAEEKKRYAEIPYDESEFRKQCGLVESARVFERELNPVVQTWRLPSLTVNAIQASSRKQAGNIINDVAWAKVTIRLVPDMDPQKVFDALKAHLKKKVPWGLEVQFGGDAVGAWSIDPAILSGPAFQAASVAMEKGYGKKPLLIGSGGSIPFVQPFADALGGVPALLIGVEDPYTNAHGENESLLIEDFKKSCLSQIHLFEELSSALSKGARPKGAHS